MQVSAVTPDMAKNPYNLIPGSRRARDRHLKEGDTLDELRRHRQFLHLIPFARWVTGAVAKRHLEMQALTFPLLTR